jgi:PadR family transcriptional regulator PadR
MNIGKDLVAASATPLVLAILSEGESYGYAIIKRVDELSGGDLNWTDGMLYPVLHRLERHGYVKSTWGKSESGRKRKYYRRQWKVVNDALRATSFHSFEGRTRDSIRTVRGAPVPPPWRPVDESA